MADSSGQTFSISGVSYTFMPLTQGMKAAYSGWVSTRLREAAIDTEMALQRRARAIRRNLIDDSRATATGGNPAYDDLQREEMTADVNYLLESASRQTKEFNEAKTTGKLHFTGELCIETMRSTEGSVKMMQIMLQANHPEIAKDMEALTKLYNENSPSWVDAIREVGGMGKKPVPFGSEKMPTDEEEMPK